MLFCTHSNMIIVKWLCLIMISQYIQARVITIDNNGTLSLPCCRDGLCACNSLYFALSFMESNTIINITSPAVSLNFIAKMNYLNNIIITSSAGATVMCNNTGSVFCYGCNDVTIEAITWDQCGDTTDSIVGIFFDAVFNISIINCTFQHSSVCHPLYISQPVGTVKVINSAFMFNMVSDASLCESATYSSFNVFSSNSIDVIIYDSLFYYNGNSLNGSASFNGSLMIYFNADASTQSVLVKNTSFVSNGIGSMNVQTYSRVSNTIFDQINVSDNRFGVYLSLAVGKNIWLSSHFTHNDNGALSVLLSENATFELYNTTFANNIATANTLGSALYVQVINDSTINVSKCSFHDNVGGNSIVYIIVGLPFDFLYNFCNVLITSSNFTGNKFGSPLRVSKCFSHFIPLHCFKTTLQEVVLLYT